MVNCKCWYLWWYSGWCTTYYPKIKLKEGREILKKKKKKALSRLSPHSLLIRADGMKYEISSWNKQKIKSQKLAENTFADNMANLNFYWVCHERILIWKGLTWKGNTFCINTGKNMLLLRLWNIHCLLPQHVLHTTFLSTTKVVVLWTLVLSSDNTDTKISPKHYLDIYFIL